MSTEREIRFRVVMDDAGVPAAAVRSEASIKSVQHAVERSSGAFLEFGRNGQVTARQLQALSYQASDIVTQLAGGQNPLLILLQQGGQLRDQFGGVGNVFRAVAQTMTLTRVAGLGAAAALGAVALAAYQSWQETVRLEKGLALSGQQGVATVGQLRAVARGIADATASTIGNARAVVEGLAASSAVSVSQLELATRAVTAYQRLSGASAADAVKEFASMREGVTQWAIAHSRSFNYITPSQVAYLRNLEAQGRTQEAMRVNLELVARTMESRAAPAFGTLEKAIEAAKKAGSDFWDWLKSLGRPESVDEQIANLRRLAEEAELLKTKWQPANAPTIMPPEMSDAAGRLRDLERQRNRDLVRRSETGITQEQINDQIMRMSRAFVDAQLAVEASGAARMLAQERHTFTQRFLVAERGYQQLELAAEKFGAEHIAIERGRLAAEERAARVALSIESRRVVASPQEELARQAAVINAERTLIELKTRRLQLEERIKRGEFDKTPVNVFNTARDQFNIFEKAGYAGSDAFIADQRAQGQQTARELVTINRSMSIELIQDARQRGMALIAEEERQLRQRLNLEAQSDADRKEFAERLASWRVQREAQLTEELKPEWQRQVEAWADATQAMKRTRDDFLNGWVNTGRDVFEQFVMTGKLNISSLVNFARAEFAKMVYERFLVQSFSSLGISLFGSLFGGGGGGASVFTAAIGSSGFGGMGYIGGGAAAGSNFVERDMLTILHKGEAVVPKAFNPAAGGAGAAPGVVVNQTINVAPGTDPTIIASAMEASKRAAVAEVMDAMRRGRLSAA